MCEISTHNNDEQQNNTEPKEEDQKLTWTPTLNICSEYIGNGFMKITLTECDSAVNLFELKYCFSIIKYHNQSNENELSFNITDISPQKMSRNSLLIRIPLELYDYHFIFQFRAHAIKEGTSLTKWTKYTNIKSIFIPFDVPLYTFKTGDIVRFQLPNHAFWAKGKIIKISEEITQKNNGSKIADILYEQSDSNHETFQINVNNLKFADRQRHKLIDLTNWMDLCKHLFFNEKMKNIKIIQNTFVAVYNVLETNITKWIYNQSKGNNNEQRSFLQLVYFGAIDQDIKCCARFIALNICIFLEEIQVTKQCNNNVINNGMYIGCGLCPIENNYQTVTKLSNNLQCKLLSFTAYGKQTGYKPKECFNFIDMVKNGTGCACDICLIEFHSMDYIYCCESSLDKQHDICIQCMNKNVLEYKRLLNTLNDLYFIHELDHYCVSQIIYFVIGLVRLNK
eukprot:124_1